VSLHVRTAQLAVAAALTAFVAMEQPASAAKAAAPAAKAAAVMTSADAWPSDIVSEVGQRPFELALDATRCAASTGVVKNPATLTVIDYSRPSTEPRMWVVDLASRTILYEELVAHGQGSGGNLATRFSNEPDSHQSSLGLFVTGGTYVGKNGYSLRMTGLEPGFNDRALERAIVIHGAPYVNGAISQSLGRLGRSFGCPAVREPVARALIDRVKDGSVVFAYYPDRDWLSGSKFLNHCTAQPTVSNAS